MSPPRKKEPKAVQCSNCRFYATRNEYRGQCRRLSPSSGNAWVEVKAEDWCGEYEECA